MIWETEEDIGDKIFSSFIQYSVGKAEDECFPNVLLLRVPSKHFFINPTLFNGEK